MCNESEFSNVACNLVYSYLFAPTLMPIKSECVIPLLKGSIVKQNIWVKLETRVCKGQRQSVKGQIMYFNDQMLESLVIFGYGFHCYTFEPEILTMYLVY